MLGNNLIQNIVVIVLIGIIVSPYVPQIKNMLPPIVNTYTDNCLVRLGMLLVVAHLLNNTIERMTGHEAVTDEEMED